MPRCNLALELSQYGLLPIQDLEPPSQAESSFLDGSDMLFSLYNEKAADHVQNLAKIGREDAQGIMFLVRHASPFRRILQCSPKHR